MHKLAATKAPTIDTILEQPFLKKLITDMRKCKNRTQFLTLLQRKITTAERNMETLDSNQVLLYNALVCGLHVVATGSLTEIISDALISIGSFVNWCSRGIDSILGWLGLKTIISDTIAYLSTAVSDSGLGSIINIQSRFQFMKSAQIKVDPPLEQLTAPLTLARS